MSEPPIPLVDLAWQHQEIAEEVRAGWDEVLKQTSFVLGPAVAEFEHQYAQFSSVSHCVGVANGTDALEMALRAAGVQPGHEVVVPANTFIASALAVSRIGARVVLADCDPATYLMTPETLEPVVSSETKVIMPVHLYGQMAPVQEIIEAFPGVTIVEDGAQSQGATRHGRKSGSVGHIGATSFYPGKNIGAYGDAGAVVTNDDDLAQAVRELRNWGSEVKYHHPRQGFNSRLDTLQAVVLSAKLKRLDSWNASRANAAALYNELLSGMGVVLPRVAEGNQHVWHLYVIEVEDHREEILARMQSRGVGVGVHYPVPIHLQGAYQSLGYARGDFPHAEKAAQRVLSLPLHPGLTPDDQMRVVKELQLVLDEMS